MIGQVLEGVQPLPNDSRILALTEAMTAFMEAWMEHILKQKIKFRLVNMWWSSGLTVAVHVPFLLSLFMFVNSSFALVFRELCS